MSRPLNIFILHPSSLLTDWEPSGDGLLAYQYVSRLAARGHIVHVAVEARSVRGTCPPNLHLHDIRTHYSAAEGAAGLAQRVEFGIKAGALFRRLRKTIAFDVVHQLNPVVYGLSMLASYAPTPLVLGPIPPSWAMPPGLGPTFRQTIKARTRRLLMHLQLQRARLILIPTPAVLDQIITTPALLGRIRALHYGVDQDAFSPFSDDPAPQAPTILFLANLWRRKGIFTLLDAFEIVHRALPEARLLIAGSGTDQEEVKARAAESSASRQIQFLGFIEHDHIPEVMRRCSVFCLPSFGEPFGMTALEAMACGKALVVTNRGGLSHLVDDEGGIKVPAAEPGPLAEALVKVLSSPELARTMGAHNRQSVLRTFAWDKVITELEGIYLEAMSTVAVSRRALDVPARR